MTDKSKEMNDFLTEEMEEEALFKSLTQHRPGGADGIVHSVTSDTLDSVYLDPPAIEQDIEGPEESGILQLQLDKIQENDDTSNVNDALAEVSREADVKDFSIGETKEIPPKQPSEPSLSKYFGTADDDPFSQDFFGSLPPVNEDKKSQVIDTQEVNETNSKVATPMENEEVTDEMFNLTLNDTKENLNSSAENSNSNSNQLSFQDPTVAEVDFELEVDETETVETPVALEEKDDFESFTADIADSETLDALGMSPAAPSYMNDRHLRDFFRQTSQPDSRSPLSVNRQFSHSSATENITPVAEMTEEHMHSLSGEPPAAPLDHATVHQGTREDVVPNETTPVHQPMFPPSTTLSPVDSPVHQQLPGTHEIPLTTPEHKLSAFKSFTDSGMGDDPFSTSLQMSDSDRQHDAWIPSEASKNVLIAMATNSAGSYMPDSELLVMPMLVITEPQGDPVRDLVYRYMGEQEALKRQVLSADRVSQDSEGIKQLMEAGCHRSAIDLTGRLLTQIGQSQAAEIHAVHSAESLQLWYCRFSLMMKLRMYNIVESEIVAFKNMDTPDIYYEFYPQLYPGKRGSIVPFGMRLLHAELPHHLGRSQETLERLYYMLAITQKILKNLNDGLSEDGSAITITADSRKASQDLWEDRQRQTLYCIGNTMVAVRDYDAALSVYDMLLENDPDHRTSLLSGLGRIHLQIGNLPKAMEYFQEVQSSTDLSEGPATISLLMCRGFEAMCQNNFNEAYQNFKSAVQADPANPSAVNNMAVCCLYLGRLKEALKSLEALVHGNPSKNLHEGILFNLCTLYELESSRALHKKQALLDLVSKHKGDGFPVVCLKMA